jgi:hypothetical protein
MAKKRLVGTTAIVLFISLYFVVQLFYWSPHWQTIINRCTDYDPQSLGMVDCYGVISIWQPDNSGYIIQNNSDQGPIIAQIKGPHDLVVQGDQIYLIDITPAGGCAHFQPGYCSTFQVGGKPKTISYNDPNQTPRYLIINTETGDERFYVKPQDASSTDQGIFQELIAKEH